MTTAGAIIQTLESANVPDNNGECANVVDAIDKLSRQVNHVAHAITADAAPNHDEMGGTVASLTEAVMGTTKALSAIADAINNLADAVRERNQG